MSPNWIERYFLRICAQARFGKLESDQASDPYAEAVLQTFLLVGLIASSVVSSVLAVRPLFPAWANQLLADHGPFAIVTLGMVIAAGAYWVARRIAARYRNQPEVLDRFNSPSDRRSAHVQFWIALGIACGAPFAAHFALSVV